MVQTNLGLVITIEVGVPDIVVAFALPPGAQLSIPRAGQDEKQVRMLETE